MKNIIINHNPYKSTTKISIDGNYNEKISKDCANLGFENIYKNILNKIITECAINCNIDVEFIGIVEHFEDLQKIKGCVEEIQGIKLDLKHTKIDQPSEMLNKIKEAYKIFNETDWGEFDNGIGDLKKDFEDLMQPNVEVNVIATMSSGKSTLINAMIGRDLLPAANAATTATVLRFFDTENTDQIIADRIGEDESYIERNIDITENVGVMLKEWNRDVATKEIDLYGKLHGIKSQIHSKLVLVDTPGPNNSQNDAHRLTTERILQKIDNSIVLYVLNATQPGINDDFTLLNSVREAMDKSEQAHDRFIFVVNQIDALNHQKGESVESALSSARNYLENTIGIKSPNIYPVSSRATLLFRLSADNVELTDDDDSDLYKYKKKFTSIDLSQYMPLSPHVKQIIDDKLKTAKTPEEQALIKSGVPILEEVINEHLEKYALAKRVGKLSETLQQIVENIEIKVEAKKALLGKQDDEVQKELEKLNSDRTKIERLGKDIVDQLSTEPEIDTDTIKEITAAKQEGSKEAFDIVNKLTEKGTLENIPEGKKSIKETKAKIKDIYAKLCVVYEQIITNENNKLIQKTKSDFIEKLQKLFDDENQTKSLFEKSIMADVAALKFDSLVSQYSEDIHKGTRKEIKTKKEEKKVWYKLWLGTTTVYERYEEDVQYQFIDCKKEGEELQTNLEIDLDQIQEKVSEHIKESRSSFINDFKNNTLGRINGKIEQIESNAQTIQHENAEEKNAEKQRIEPLEEKIQQIKKGLKCQNS